MYRSSLRVLLYAFGAVAIFTPAISHAADPAPARERISIDDGWRFTKGDPASNSVSLLYDVRPVGRGRGRGRGGPAPTDASTNAVTNTPAPPPPDVIKQWILPDGNAFIKDPAKRFNAPEAKNWDAVAYACDFDDGSWEAVNLAARLGDCRAVYDHRRRGPRPAAVGRRGLGIARNWTSRRPTPARKSFSTWTARWLTRRFS